jgi:hypothetical protein
MTVETLGLWCVILAALMTAFGVPVLAVGLVLRLCEWSWPTPPGGLGSRGLLIAGGVLCVPLFVILAEVGLERLGR